MPGFYREMAALVLLLHAIYIAWVIFGALFTRGRARLAALHVGTLLYGIIVEIFGLWCPLTALEQWLEIRGGVSPYREPFLLHYLDAVVYPRYSPKTSDCGRCGCLHFESRNLCPAPMCSTFARMKRGQRV